MNERLGDRSTANPAVCWPWWFAVSVISFAWFLELAAFERWRSVPSLSWIGAWLPVVVPGLLACSVLSISAVVIGGRHPTVLMVAATWGTFLWAMLAFGFYGDVVTWFVPSVCAGLASGHALALYATTRRRLVYRWRSRGIR